MEDSTQLQTLTLEPSVSAYSFPRRMLRSRTYNTLIPFLSQLRSVCPRPNTQDDTCDVDSGQVSEENGVIGDMIKSMDVSALSHDLKERGDKLAEETGTDNSKENVNCGVGGFDCGEVTIHELDCLNVMMEEEQKAIQANSFSISDFLVDDNQTKDCVFQIVEGTKDMNSALNVQMDGVELMGQLEFAKEFSLDEFSEVLNSSFGMDVVVESLKEVEVNDIEENMQNESERQLQLKEMELEKLISNPHEVDSSCFADEDEEIEEGEISGEPEVADDLVNELSEDASSLGDKTTGMVQASENNVDEGQITCNSENRVRLGYDVSYPLIIYKANSGSDCKMAELRTTATRIPDNHSENVFRDCHTETRAFGPAAPCLENLSPSGGNLQENVDKNQVSAATTKDGDEGTKKRKKGPLTKERKAKKKRKDRIKRAEKNRKLGIKRLKLQPEVKPKTIKYCRHYLQGRCHEGEKCKFSHDTIPLTKSKPCSYFARQSCMKGDDCPFDHDLSKYPCNNYTSKGFCHRSSDCLFSHEIPAKESFSTTPSVSKPELNPQQFRMPSKEGSFIISKVSQPSIKFTLPLNNSSFSENADNCSLSHQKVDSKLCSGGKISNKKLDNLQEPSRAPRQIPKGVSFLLNGGTPHGDISKLRQDGSSPKAGDVIVNKTTLKEPDSINKSNEVSTPTRLRGINFLSFAQKPSLDNTSSKMLSSLFSNGKGKSVVGDFVEGKQSHLLSGNGESVKKYDMHMSLKATNTVHNLNEGAIKIPPVNIPSLSKTQLDGSANGNPFISQKTSLLSNTPSTVQKAVQSTLAFAAKFETNTKLDHSFFGRARNSQVGQ